MVNTKSIRLEWNKQIIPLKNPILKLGMSQIKKLLEIVLWTYWLFPFQLNLIIQRYEDELLAGKIRKILKFQCSIKNKISMVKGGYTIEKLTPCRIQETIGSHNNVEHSYMFQI